MSLKLQIRSLEPGKSFRGAGTGTHQLGAFISAVSCEDEAVLSRGNGHHWGVHQAQLHDSGIIGTKGGRVVQPDPRGVTATWWARGQGQVTAGTGLKGEKQGEVKNDAVLPWGASHSQRFLFQILQIFVQVFTEWPQMHLAPC